MIGAIVHVIDTTDHVAGHVTGIADRAIVHVIGSVGGRVVLLEIGRRTSAPLKRLLNVTNRQGVHRRRNHAQGHVIVLRVNGAGHAQNHPSYKNPLQKS